MSVSAGVSDAAIAVREKLRGKIGQTRVKRYWPGKLPEWAVDDEARVEEEEEEEERGRGGRGGNSSKTDHLLERAFPSLKTRKEELERVFPTRDEDPFASAKEDDARLRRLAESRREREEAVARHRLIRQVEIISTREEERRAQEGAELEEQDEDAIEERRRRIRENLLQKRREEEAALARVQAEEDEENEEEDEEEDEDDSEYETESEDEFGPAMIKPVFVPKAERDTIQEREKLEAEDRAYEEAVKKRLEERKVETKQIVIEEIRKEEEVEKNMEADADAGEIDTDDELNEEEYEAWKSREIARIKRDRDNRETMLREKEEIEKVRNMTEEERREWERRNPKPTAPVKKKWKFMQKYYHKGAFFQNDPDEIAEGKGQDDIYRRDFSEPTGEDKLNKTILPKVMQVKHFGRSGRTKWTHLVAEDTTDWNNPWSFNDVLRAKYNSKMAGMNRPVAKPKGSKKIKDWEA